MMLYSDTVILVFAKAPISGEVNTRLIPDMLIHDQSRRPDRYLRNTMMRSLLQFLAMRC